MKLLKNFWNELKCSPLITAINITGYAVALATCIILGSYIYYQTTFDKFNTRASRIYRLNYFQNAKQSFEATTNHQWYEVLPDEFPEIEKMARFGWPGTRTIETKKGIVKAIGASGDEDLFDIFSFNITERASDKLFENPNSIAISESLAEKLFGTEPAIGKQLELNYNSTYTVTGIFEDIPKNSSVYFELLYDAKEELARFGEDMQTHWTWWMWRTFILTGEHTDNSTFTARMKPLQTKFIGNWHAEQLDYYLQPLKEIHLRSGDINGSFEQDVQIEFIYIIASAALLILIISCINYVNLSLAGFEARKKAISIRKIIGASRRNIFFNYIGLSLILSFISILLALLMIKLLMPVLEENGIYQIQLLFNKPYFWLSLLIFSILIGSLSGLFPARFISKTVTQIKHQASFSRLGFRNVLIVFQFAIAIILLISANGIKKQLHESIKGDLGYNHSSMISFSGSANIWDHYEAFHQELKKIPDVLATTSCAFQLPGYFGNYWPIQPAGAPHSLDIFHTYAAPDFFEALNIPIEIKMLEFREDTSKKVTNAVLNVEAVKQIGLGESIVGSVYNMGDSKIRIIGVVSNFHNNSMRNRIKPLQLQFADKCWNNLIRIGSKQSPETLAAIEKVWNQFEPKEPFEYKFIDELILEMYANEKTELKLINAFFLIAMFISLIGLVGIVQLILRFKVKEIGIRKVNGARTVEIVQLLNWNFIKNVLFAFLIACPVAYYATSRWLENFEYRVTLSWWIFALSGMGSTIVALVTITAITWYRASRNPVEALHYE